MAGDSVSHHSKIEALRALAERPGTVAEGMVARQMLARLLEKRHGDKPVDEREAWAAFEDYLRGDRSTDEYLEAMRRWVDKRR